jgi:putative tryptophan/tyrosine transport system substrate-binding protein
MRRREFITLAGAATWPIAARAQQHGRTPLIGVLMAYTENDSTAQSWLAAFRAALAKLGWTEGSNLQIELRWSAANADTMRTLAKELVDLRPNAIFGVTTPAVGALARETTTIPIVFAGVSDPIGGGFVANLAHPGGNIAGFTTGNADPALGGKWVELFGLRLEFGAAGRRQSHGRDRVRTGYHRQVAGNAQRDCAAPDTRGLGG